MNTRIAAYSARSPGRSQWVPLLVAVLLAGAAGCSGERKVLFSGQTESVADLGPATPNSSDSGSADLSGSPDLLNSADIANAADMGVSDTALLDLSEDASIADDVTVTDSAPPDMGFDLPTDVGIGPDYDVASDPLVDQSDQSGAEPLVVVVVSDLNGSYGTTTYRTDVHEAVRAVIELGPDLVLSTGDMVAGQKADLDYLAMWDGFHAAVSDPLADAGIPFAVTPGNHDASGYSGYTEERSIYVNEWTARRPDVTFIDDTYYPLRYTFSMGDTFFVSLDDTKVGHLDDTQMAWLDAQLMAAADFPVKIVFGHVPLYPFAIGRESDALNDAALETLLIDHDVTMFISGHHHTYYPGRRGDLRLVSTSCLGAAPRALIGTDTLSPRSVLRIVIEDGEVTYLEALQTKTFVDVIPRSELPVSVGVGDATVWRDDQ